MTRAQNSFYNIITTLLSSVLLPILNFVTRTVFIRCLGDSYLGIEGVFSNILMFLSLANLGFDAAIAYELYHPLEEKDFVRVHALMDLYKKVYRIIGCVILGAGLCLIPLLPVFVKDYELFAELGLNAVVVFLMYLFNSATSYWFFAYKATLMSAAQKSYVLTIVGYAVSIVGTLCQILALVLTHNFLVYLAVQILFAILRKLINAIVCDRRFPFLREKAPEPLPKEQRKKIFKECYAIFFHRMNGTILNVSDTIVLTSMAGMWYVGLYSNYLAVKNAVYGVVGVITSALQASMGSLFAADNKDWTRLLYRAVSYVTCWFYGIGAIGVAVLTDSFISDVWIGERFVVSGWEHAGHIVYTPLALLVGIELYFLGHANVGSLFRNTSGLFYRLRYRPIYSILVNLIVSLLTVPYLGIAGCVVGTIVALGTGEILIDSIVINRRALEQSPLPYFLRLLGHSAIIAVSGVLCWQLCRLVPLGGVAGFLVRGVICVVTPTALFLGLTCRSTEFRYLVRAGKFLLKRMKP